MNKLDRYFYYMMVSYDMSGREASELYEYIANVAKQHNCYFDDCVEIALEMCFRDVPLKDMKRYLVNWAKYGVLPQILQFEY